MATNQVFCSYQEIIDLHTESDTVSVVGIHTPTGDVPKQMFSGFYKQFKKMKYLGCSLAMVPAARLPADPLQVSYEAGEPTIDPRDMLNPIMFHGCHGNDMGAILNTMYSAGSIDVPLSLSSGVGNVDRFPSAEITNVPQAIGGGSGIDFMESLYYKALTDNTWQKAHPQRGFKKNGLVPKVYQVATNTQYMPTTAENPGQANSIEPKSYEYFDGEARPVWHGTFGPGHSTDAEYTTNALRSALNVGRLPAGVSFTVSGTNVSALPTYSVTAQQFFTNKLTNLGWMDTYQPVRLSPYIPDAFTGTTNSDANVGFGSLNNTVTAALASTWDAATLPRIYMGMILLPPAYKTEQYFRLILNHRFSFKNFRGISMQSTDVVEALEAPSYFNANGDTVQMMHADGNGAPGAIVTPLMMPEGVPIDVGIHGSDATVLDEEDSQTE